MLKTCLEFLHQYYEGHLPAVYFSCRVLIWFRYLGNTSILEQLGEHPLLFASLEMFTWIFYYFFLKCLAVSPNNNSQ